MRSEAQLAAVLGHEAGHYLRRHSIRTFRNRKTKAGVMSVVALGANIATGLTGNATWIDLAGEVNKALLLSIFSYSRSMESEADAYGIKLLESGAYNAAAASETWAQFVAERKASASALDKKYRDGARSAYSTHPPNEERMTDLREFAAEIALAHGEQERDDGRDRFMAAIAPVRAALLEEQIKLNDSGASLYLIESLAADGWDGLLRYYEGEAYRLRGAEGDDAKAAASFAAAVAFMDCPPEAYRSHGYALIKAGRKDEGRQALVRFLELQPDARDASVVRAELAKGN